MVQGREQRRIFNIFYNLLEVTILSLSLYSIQRGISLVHTQEKQVPPLEEGLIEKCGYMGQNSSSALHAGQLGLIPSTLYVPQAYQE